MKNTKRGFVIPLLIAIIALLVIGGGVYIYFNQQPKTLVTNQVENNVATTSDSSVNSQVASSTQNQTSAPIINSIESLANPSYQFHPGDKVTIKGLNFPVDGKHSPIIYIGSTKISDVSGLVSATPQSITFTVPSISQGNYSLYVSFFWNDIVNNTSGQSKTNSVQVIVLDSTQNQTSTKVSVDGMQQYTDSSFGFSFWYPNSWTLTQNTVTNPDDNGWFQGGSIVKELNVHGAHPSDGVTVQEFHSSGLSITELGQTKSANPVGVDQKYFFDPSVHTWMYENLTESPSGVRPAGTITPAIIVNNTMGGLHIFSGARRFGSESIIPLSASDFLVVSYNDPTNDIQGYFVNTIVATDPSVATPLSTASQTQVIQAEAAAYAGQ